MTCRRLNAKWWDRWVASRQMVIGMTLSAASYVPAMAIGGEWISVFGSLALATVGLGQLKNIHDNHVAAQSAKPYPEDE